AGLGSVLVNPSPKSQLEVRVSPSGSDERFEKRTVSGAVPLAGSARKSARGALVPPVGGPLLPGVPGVPVLPPLVAARTVMLCCRGVEARRRASGTGRGAGT